jgi:hypothetical protein
MAGLTWHSRIVRLNWALKELMVYKDPKEERAISAARCLDSFCKYVENHPEKCSKEELEKLISDAKLEIGAQPYKPRPVRRRRKTL